ncbi:MAG TPA: site-specific integrase [Candidatus Competibacteraceae bacterium]|nr:site-specific integrase [Candidatus Competibacteraceae bacterium]HSA45640.1 site-specific integrase [Candidatus Competibacteraceae bacterium]
MPVVNLTNKLLNSIKPTGEIADYRDQTIKGFMVRLQKSGEKSYILEYGRGKRFTIGLVGQITLDQAKEIAQDKLALVRQGHDLNADKRAAKAKAEAERRRHTFKTFIDKEYEPWVKVHRKSASDTLQRLRTHFYPEFGDSPLEEITPWQVEKWKAKRAKEGIKTVTTNRLLAAFKATLSKAVEWNLITEHPLAKLKLKGGADGNKVVRYLNLTEETALRDALDKREKQLRQGRESGNQWRRNRGYVEKVDLTEAAYAHHLKPMVLISLNTGIRQGELFALTWADVDFDRASLTVHGDNAKSGKTRHIPLNHEALSVFTQWKVQELDRNGLIFPSRTGVKIDNVQKSWTTVLEMAGIKEFRWHDLRHTFASNLVMRGVDLNTVRELMGHADIKMTLRYAHLAPEHKAKAVAQLSRFEEKIIPLRRATN